MGEPTTTVSRAWSRAQWMLGPAMIMLVQAIWFGAPAGVMINGVVLGLLTALVALGMFLVHRANRVLNFAQGELGLVPAVLAVMLVVESGWPWLLALAVGSVAALTLGGAAEFLVVRRFFRAPRLVLTVATLGLAQGLGFLALLMPRWWDTRVASQRIAAPIDQVWDVGPVRLDGDHLVILAVVPLVLLAVGTLLRRTDLGVAIRAAAELPDRAASLGVPVRSVHTVVWALAAFLAFLALFLRAGVIGLPVGGSLGFSLLLRALAALMIGRLTHLPTVLASSVALGVLHQGVDWNQDSSLVGDTIMAAVIVVALLVRRDRGDRGEVDLGMSSAVGEIRRIPAAIAERTGFRLLRWSAISAAAGVSLWLPHVLGVQNVLRLSFLHLYTIVLVSMVVLTGWAGQLSLGHMAFVAVGAVTGAVLSQELGADLLLAVLGAGVAGVVASLVVGLPALRLRGLYLAVTSLAFAVATTSYLLNPRFFDWIPTDRVERHPLLGRIDWTSSFAMYHVSLLAVVVAFIAVSGLRHSRTGRVLLALRDNEATVAAYGVSPTRAKLTAFALSGFFASAAGALIVHHQQAVVIDGAGAQASIRLFVAGVAGGMGSMIGAALGALYYWGGVWWLPGNWRLLALGGGVLVVLLVLPGGLANGLYRLRDHVVRRYATARGIDAPGFTPDRPDDGSTP